MTQENTKTKLNCNELNQLVDPIAKEKTLPHDADAEIALLISLLTGQAEKSAIIPFIKPDHFYLPKHATIYEALLRLHEKSTVADLGAVASELLQYNELRSAEAFEYLMGIRYEGLFFDVLTNLKIVVDKYVRRQIILISTQTYEEMHREGSDVITLAKVLLGKLRSLRIYVDRLPWRINVN